MKSLWIELTALGHDGWMGLDTPVGGEARVSFGFPIEGLRRVLRMKSEMATRRFDWILLIAMLYYHQCLLPIFIPSLIYLIKVFF